MNIEHISVSRKGVWDLCHQQYKYKYHLKVPNPGEEPFYFVYGKIIHKIAESWIDGKGERLISEVASDVMTGKIEIEPGKKAPPIPMEYKRRIPEHLSSIKKLTDQIGMEGKLEHKFHYDLDPPNGKFVTGFIDRLIQKDDNFIIIDYKTTKKGMWRKDTNTIRKDLQLRCYGRVVQREFGAKAENIMAALYYLEGGNLVATKFTEQSLASSEKELLDAYNQIVTADPDHVRGRVGQHCTRCDYRKMCPFYSVS